MGLFNLFRQHKKVQPTESNESLESFSNEQIYSADIKLKNTNNDYSLDNPVLEDGLLYGDILMLNWLNGQKTNKKIPGYFVECFQINPIASKQKYKERGLLISGSIESRLQTLRIPELKAILKENNQKISGRKELINRILQNVDNGSYINSLPKTFGLSDQAKTLLKKYKLLIWANNNEHILSPKDYLPFINSPQKNQKLLLDFWKITLAK